MKPVDLSDLFDKILRLSLAASPLAGVAGCGPDLSLFSEPACVGSQLAVSGLQPTTPVDYIELRERNDLTGDPMPRVVAQSGTKCATAGDRAACESAVAAISSMETFFKSCFDYCVGYQLVTTRGDQVQTIDTPAAWRAFLGTIDTPQEAVLSAWTAGYSINCSNKERGAVRSVPGGFEVIGTKGYTCGANTSLRRYVVLVGSDGGLSEVSEEVLQRGDPNCVIGRRPAGLRGGRMRAASTRLGRHFARSAALEAASVDAFLVMCRELRAHGVPAELLLAARAAATDEVRHARVTGALARRHGGHPVRPQVSPRPLRSLEEIATENAVEGCVRETYGALVGRWQGQHAADPQIAAAMAEIAIDETRHAALSWQVAEWAEARLPAAALRRVRVAQRQAVQELLAEIQVPPAGELVTRAGLPSAATAQLLAGSLARSLWA